MIRCPIIDLAEARFRRRAAMLHARGPRPTVELLVHVGRNRLLADYLDQLVEEFLAVPDTALDITGAREMPPELPS